MIIYPLLNHPFPTFAKNRRYFKVCRMREQLVWSRHLIGLTHGVGSGSKIWATFVCGMVVVRLLTTSWYDQGSSIKIELPWYIRKRVNKKNTLRKLIYRLSSNTAIKSAKHNTLTLERLRKVVILPYLLKSTAKYCNTFHLTKLLLK